MKIFYTIILFSLLLSSCSESIEDVGNQMQDNIYKKTKYTVLSANAFKTKIDEKEGVLIDVRSKEEFEAGHIDGAINIDYFSKDFKDQISALDNSKAILVYCASGNRSGKSSRVFMDSGFTELYDLSGGYSGWPFK